jgi:hypothetical protein
VRTFKTAIKAMNNENAPIDMKVSKFLLAYRTTTHSTTNETPAFMLFKRQLRTSLSLLKPSTTDTVHRNLQRQQRNHDQNVKQREFEIGDSVFVRQFTGHKKWRAGIIKNHPSEYTYDIQIGSDVVRRHIDHLLANRTRGTDLSEEDEEEEISKRLSNTDWDKIIDDVLQRKPDNHSNVTSPLKQQPSTGQASQPQPEPEHVVKGPDKPQLINKPLEHQPDPRPVRMRKPIERFEQTYSRLGSNKPK